MNKKHLKILTLILVSLSLGGCPMDYGIPSPAPAVYLENNSEHGIVVCWNYCFSYYIPDQIIRTDTLLPMQYYSSSFDEELDGPAPHNPLRFIIEPGDKSCVECLEGNPLEELYATLSHDTLSVFVLHVDTVRQYSWEQICADNNIVVRYDLSKEDVLSFKNHIVPFPPTEAMRDMKMWPPYEEIRKRYTKLP